jgi:DNA repair exonuclease SbcCD nuclease subunit
VFSGRAEAVELACSGRPVAIHGLSFARPEAPESLLPRYKPPLDGAINIGLLHTSLNGSPGHDPYAPCALEDLHAAGFRYWALGHIHKRSVIKGAATVVMPGIPQGRDINEAGPKSVTLVTVDDAGAIEVEERLTSIAQFERVNIELSGCTEWREAVSAIRRALEQMRGSVVSEHGIARLRLTGATPLAWRLRQDPDLLLAEAENEAAGIGKTWIEKIEIECRPAQPGLPSSPDSAVPLGELHRLMSAVIADQAYQDEMVRHADHLRGQLPAECREFLGRDEAAFREFVREAAREGAEDVLACLAPAEKAERD